MPFFLLPLLTNYLTPEEYGFLGIATVLVGILRLFIGLNASIFVITKFSAYSKSELAENIFYALLTIGATLLLVLGVLYSFSPLLASEFGLSFGLIVVISLTAALMEVEALCLVILQMQKKARLFFVFSVFSALLQFAFVFYIIVVLDQNWQGKLIGDLIAVVLVAGTVLYAIIKQGYIRPGWAPGRIKVFFLFTLPILPHAVSLWVMNFSDRILLAQYRNIEEVGIYSAAYTIGLGMMLVYDALQRTWQPYFFEILNENDDRRKAGLIIFTWLYYLGCILLLVIAVLLLNWIGPLILADEFLLALQIVPLIFLGYTFHGMYRAVAGYLYHADKSGVLALVTVSAAVLNAGLNLILIPEKGMVGAAQATVYTFLYIFIVVQLLSVKYVEMPWLSVFRRRFQDEVS